VSKRVLVGALLSETGYAEESAVLLEMKDLGGRTLAIANQLSPEVRRSADLAIELALPVPELARLSSISYGGSCSAVILACGKDSIPTPSSS